MIFPDEVIRKLPCSHIFHEVCVLPWFKVSEICPNCRFNVQEFFEKKDKKEEEETKEHC